MKRLLTPFFPLFIGATIILQSQIGKCTKIPSNVIELNDRFLEVMDHGFWFVKFYAPWCAHCKKLQPVWDRMAHALSDQQSPIRVGKLDCTRFPSVTSALHIHGYPTLIFFRNGNQIHYEGERRKDELVKFAEKCSGPIVGEIESPTKFIEMRKNSDKEPFFVFYDPEQRAEKEPSGELDLWRQFENISESMFTEVNFFKVRDRRVLPEELRLQGNGTKVMVFKDRDYSAIFENDKAGEDQHLFRWVGQQRWPLMPQIGASNIHAIADSSTKLLVLVIVEGVDRLNASTSSGRFFEMAKQTAEEARKVVELENNFQFGWLDGNQLANGIVMGTLPVPNVLVFNMSSYEYYLSDDQPDQMTTKSLLVFFYSVRQGEVHVQGGRAWITRLRRMLYEITSNVYDMFHHQPILTICLFGIPLAFFSIITYSICSADFSVDREEIYPEDENEESEQNNDLMDEEVDDGFTYVTPEEQQQLDDSHEKND